VQSPTSNLIRCPDCGARISARAVSCPHCGAPLKRSRVDPTIAFLEKQRRDRRANTQGCGCLLMLLAIGISILYPTLGLLIGGTLLLVGLIVLIVGFCL
jgi:hypothetical protein